jgi:hypothetical protein
MNFKKLLFFCSVLLSAAAYAQCNNYSLDFDSSSYVSIPDHPSLRGQQLTVSLYYKTTSAAIQNLFVKNKLSTAANFQYGASINHDAFSPLATYAFTTAHGGNCQIGAGYSIMEYQHGTAPENVWVQAVFTYDGITQKLYIDGVLAYSRITNKGSIDYCSGGDLLLGVNYLGSACYFKGQMDEVAVYNHALTESEISARYSRSLDPATETGLVAYYRFEEGNDTLVTDLSGNGNHGVMHGCNWTPDVPFGHFDAPVISGPDSIRMDSLVAYSVPDTGVTYTWSIVGGTIDSGQGNSTIYVSWDSAGINRLTLDIQNQFGCVRTDTMVVTAIPLPATTGVVSMESKKYNFQAYPNPAGETITLLANETSDYTIKVYNMLGAEVLEATMQSETSLDISMLAPGQYFVRLNDGQKAMTGKFVKF